MTRSEQGTLFFFIAVWSPLGFAGMNIPECRGGCKAPVDARGDKNELALR